MASTRKATVFSVEHNPTDSPRMPSPWYTYQKISRQILDSSALSLVLVKHMGLQMPEVEIQKQIEFEKLRLEQEKFKIEQERQMQIEWEKLKFDTEANERERQYNLRMKELEMQNKTVKSQPLDFVIHFDVTKHIRLVPPFQEKEVDKYFLHFEKVAENLKWPKEHWTLLLQNVIIGKAREIYTQLTVEQSSSYDTVKELIHKANRLCGHFRYGL